MSDKVRDLVAEMVVGIVDLNLIGSQPGQDRGPAGLAAGDLVAGPIEADLFPGEFG